MSVNPDIEETLIYRKLAKEVIRNIDLADVTYAEMDYYALMYIYADACSGLSAKTMRAKWPCMTDALMALDNSPRLFDWPSLAIVIDDLRGKQLVKLG